MKGKVLTIVERRFAFVDKTGIVGDQAVLRLTEDLVQHRDWHDTGADQLMEHIAGAYALQLIRVTDQKDFGAGAQT